VKINAAGLDDKSYAADMVQKGQEIVDNARAKEAEILQIVNDKIKI